ncbi:DnaJ like protein subfamily C member 19 [Angomonas deanei]|nr:DnaJ like protein subfamily C member 19 [Angomonas deanei]|eukprot:EPY39502.1 DnaJ like protein subfamily C member 19 [Angomonas deanei]
MSEREAYLLLGFPESQAGAAFRRPPEEEVKKQYRAVMKDFHSDIGGTPFIATKLNEAKDILIK